MIKFSYYVAFVVALVSAQVTGVKAQQFGVKGKVLDLETNQPIPGVSIKIANTDYATSTDNSGEFSIAIPGSGTEHTLISTFVVYDTDSTIFKVRSNEWVFVPVVLVNANSRLDEVVVTRRRERISEAALLAERKASNLMVEKIGARELSRKGVSDAEGALTKMSGVTKSAGGANVFVRGLGDRYNSSTMNGLALPSEDPLNKNISLDFFGTGIIQSIGVNKTFNPALGGDVAGANIDIVSKELSEESFLEIGASAGINSQAVNAKDFKRISGTNWFGSLKEKTHSITDFSQYQFKNSWDPKNIKNPVNSSFSLSGGKKFKIGDGNLDVFLTGNFNSEYRDFDGVSRQTNQNGVILMDQEMSQSHYNVSKTGMANLRYSFGDHYVAFNSLYINDQGNYFSRYYGKNDVIEVGDKRLFQRSHVVDNSLYVNQLLSRLKLTDHWKLDLGAGYNVVNGTEPDRRTNNLYERNGVLRVLNGARGSDNERYYSDMTEKGWTAKAIAAYTFDNENNLDRKVEFGYNGSTAKRDFNATIFLHNLKRPYEVANIDVPFDDIFNHSTLDDGVYELTTIEGSNLDPFWYKGDKQTHSALIVGTYQFTDRFTAVLGLRYDKVMQEVTFHTQNYNSNVSGPSKIEKDYFLPSANLKYALTEKSNLRASLSKSYTLPQFIELAPFRNTFATYKSEGKRDLMPVETYNVDLKWELFPTDNELFSIGVFYKQLKNPIARSEVNVAGNTMTYFNVGATAQVAGAEVEMKKNIFKTQTVNGHNILSVGANLSYLYSKQELTNPDARFTEDESALQGASPFLANADVSYLYNGSNWNLTSAIVLNYFSDRIYAVGTSDFKNTVEKAVPLLDFVANANIGKHWGVNVKMRNIVNPDFNLERETDAGEHIVLESYKRGVDGSVGVTYKF